MLLSHQYTGSIAGRALLAAGVIVPSPRFLVTMSTRPSVFFDHPAHTWRPPAGLEGVRVLDPRPTLHPHLLGARRWFAGCPFPDTLSPATALIIAGAIVPWIANLLYLSRALPVGGLDLTPIAFAVSGACFTWGIYRYRLFGLVPVARDMVVDSMDDGVIVLDAQRRLVDLNAAAERYTGCTNASLGRPIDEVVAWWNAAVAEDCPLGEGLPAPAAERVWRSADRCLRLLREVPEFRSRGRDTWIWERAGVPD